MNLVLESSINVSMYNFVMLLHFFFKDISEIFALNYKLWWILQVWLKNICRSNLAATNTEVTFFGKNILKFEMFKPKLENIIFS